MSEETPAAEISFKIKTSGDASHTITMSENATVLDLKTLLSGDDYEKIPADRQRLIYSGRVLKDPEPLKTYKIKTGNTIHMVKNAPSNAAQNPANNANPSTGSAPRAAAGVPTNMAAGTANNPLAGLTGARYAGQVNLPGMDMFGADGGMGAPPNEDQIASLLDDPNMQQTLNEALNNPQMVDMMIQNTPALRDNPHAREMLRSPEFRRMMTNPEAIRQAAQLRRLMGAAGGAGGANAFPAPGVTDNTPGSPPTDSSVPPASIFDRPGLRGRPGGGANPFAALFGSDGFGGQAGQTPAQTPPLPGSAGQGTPSTTTNTADAANPLPDLVGGSFFGGAGLPNLTPEMMQRAIQMMQGGDFNDLMGGMGGAGGIGGARSPPPPADTRPPEEIYSEQLRQLNDMGFFDFDMNIAALRRAGGSVQGAIEQLLR